MKILLIQLRQLGDVLLSAPLAEAIKRKHPRWRVHFLTSTAAVDILTGNPFLDKIYALREGASAEVCAITKIRREQYDAVIDIQRTGRSKRITLFSGAILRIGFWKPSDNIYYNRPVKASTSGYTVFERMDLLKPLGVEKTNVMPVLHYKHTDELFVDEYVKKHALGRYFVVAPAARKAEKMWQADSFGLLADMVATRWNLTPVMVYASQRELIIAKRCAAYSSRAHVLEHPFSIKQFAALVSNAIFFVGNDSFPAHVAVSRRTPAVVICGPTSGWFVEDRRTLLIYKGLECQPCNKYEACPFNMLCYRSLSPEEVFKKMERFVDKLV